MNIWNMAWRNVLRNRRRSLLSGLAIAIAAFIICLLFSLEEGMLNDMQQNVVNHVTGNVRIRNRLYSENERIAPLQFTIPDTESVLNAVRDTDGVEGATPQIQFGTAIYRNDVNYTAKGVGVDFDTSRFFTDVNTAYVSGSRPEPGRREAAVSEGLARKLGLETGDKFTIYTKTAVGGTNAMTLTVSGVVHIGDTDFNGNVFFMDWPLASSFLRTGGDAIDILVFTESGADEPAIARSLVETLGADGAGLEVLEWDRVSVLYQMYKLFDYFYVLIGLIFFLLASTVIFNTTMMAVLERTKEIGMLLSLGMSGKAIVGLFLLESVLIAVCASGAGILAGWAGVSVFSTVGLDLNAMGGSSISGMSFSSFIYPELGLDKYILVFVIGVFTAAIACIFPARMALRVQPAEALRQ